MSAPPPVASTVLAMPATGRMEVVDGKACRLIVGAYVDMAALSRVLDLLEKRLSRSQ